MIELLEITKSYGSLCVLRNITVRVKDNSAFCIRGRNGSGKSTLLKIAALILDPDQGLVIVDGKNLVSPDKSPLRIRNNIGYSFQEPLLIPYLSALENVMIANPRENPRKESEAAELLSQLGLSDRLAHSPSNLSTGEKKRVDLARALFQKPKILVADEPLLGLDPKAIDLTVNMLRDYCTTETSVLYSASDPNHASFATAIFEL